MLDLLRKDEIQLNRDAKDLLANANCFSLKDKGFIYSVIDKNFDSREDMVNTIKSFIKSTQSQNSHTDGGGITVLDASSNAVFDSSAATSVNNPLGAAGIDGVRRHKMRLEGVEMTQMSPSEQIADGLMTPPSGMMTPPVLENQERADPGGQQQEFGEDDDEDANRVVMQLANMHTEI